MFLYPKKIDLKFVLEVKNENYIDSSRPLSSEIGKVVNINESQKTITGEIEFSLDVQNRLVVTKVCAVFYKKDKIVGVNSDSIVKDEGEITMPFDLDIYKVDAYGTPVTYDRYEIYTYTP